MYINDTIDKLAIDFNEFVSHLDDKDAFEYVKKHSHTISNKDYPGVCNHFNRRRLYGQNLINEYLYPEFNDFVATRWKSRFVILDCQSTNVYVAFRIQDNIGIRRYGIPLYNMIMHCIADNRDVNLEEHVLTTLQGKYVFSCAMRYNTDEMKTFNYNFHIFKDDFVKMRSSKWRSSHGINKLSKILDVRYKSYDMMTDNEKYDMVAFGYDWEQRRMNVKYNINKNVENMMFRYPHQDNIYYIMIYIGNILISTMTVIVVNQTAFIATFRQISPYIDDIENDIITEHRQLLKSYLCDFSIWNADRICFDEYDCNMIHIGGVVIVNDNEEFRLKKHNLHGYKGRLFPHEGAYAKHYDESFQNGHPY